jgi:phytoene synthase
MNAKLATAYAVCRGISRREARNFYYGFMVLPRAKRDALCAVYAFMRHADDVADDEKQKPEVRLKKLNAWLEDWHRVESGGASDDPVFVALADAQKKFAIRSQLLDRLVEGTSMDLRQEPSSATSSGAFRIGSAVMQAPARAPQTFQDLYRYCYLVASVVGLVCIRIYGYEDPRAEELAERCGIAFQLTNIIRDVKEDAHMGRVYLPREDLAQFGLTPEDFLDERGKQLEHSRLRHLLDFEAQRARDYYRAADELLPLVHEDSRPALWVMTTIYRRLLDRIAERDYDVLSGRISLSAAEKFGILARGFAQSIFGFSF